METWNPELIVYLIKDFDNIYNGRNQGLNRI